MLFRGRQRERETWRERSKKEILVETLPKSLCNKRMKKGREFPSFFTNETLIIQYNVVETANWKEKTQILPSKNGKSPNKASKDFFEENLFTTSKDSKILFFTYLIFKSFPRMFLQSSILYLILLSISQLVIDFSPCCFHAQVRRNFSKKFDEHLNSIYKSHFLPSFFSLRRQSNNFSNALR